MDSHEYLRNSIQKLRVTTTVLVIIVLILRILGIILLNVIFLKQVKKRITSSDESFYHALVITVNTVAGTLIVAGIMGIIGAIRENTCLLLTYGIFEWVLTWLSVYMSIKSLHLIGLIFDILPLVAATCAIIMARKIRNYRLIRGFQVPVIVVAPETAKVPEV